MQLSAQFSGWPPFRTQSVRVRGWSEIHGAKRLISFVFRHFPFSKFFFLSIPATNLSQTDEFFGGPIENPRPGHSSAQRCRCLHPIPVPGCRVRVGMPISAPRPAKHEHFSTRNHSGQRNVCWSYHPRLATKPPSRPKPHRIFSATRGNTALNDGFGTRISARVRGRLQRNDIQTFGPP